MARGRVAKPVDLRRLFLSLQSQLAAKLQMGRNAVQHASTKGEAAELNWSGMLGTYVPARYQVSKAFVLDSKGNLSDQIDIVIHDRHHSPFLLKEAGAVYVPAESVYAVFEVKQTLSKSTVEYAGAKAASVRRLWRTTAPIPHAGGVYPPKKPFRILAGILCLESSWHPPLGSTLLTSLRTLPKAARLDLGCALRHGAFEVSYTKVNKLRIDSAAGDTALIFFFLRLLARLQVLGTVPAIDLRVYGKAFKD